MPQYDIDSLLDEVVSLPSMPTTLEQVMKLMNDPDASLADIAKAISADPSISLKALRLVNSAYYGMGQEVKTVDHGVVLLGGKVVKNLVLSATVFDAIEGTAERFIRHSIACGVALRSMAAQPPLAAVMETPDEAFVYGLLHEIGRVLIAEYMPDEAEAIAKRMEDGVSADVAERETIGVDHAAIGARLAEHWRLSPGVIGALAGQYDVSLADETHRPVAAYLQLANYMAETSGYSTEPTPSAELTADAWAATGLTKADLPGVLEKYFESRGEIDELLSLAS